MTVTLEDAVLRKTRAASAVQHARTLLAKAEEEFAEASAEFTRLKTAGGEVKL